MFIVDAVLSLLPSLREQSSLEVAERFQCDVSSSSTILHKEPRRRCCMPERSKWSSASEVEAEFCKGWIHIDLLSKRSFQPSVI